MGAALRGSVVLELFGIAVTAEAVILAVGWCASVLIGILVALKLTAPTAKKMVIEEMTDPNGKIAELRAKERAEFKADVRSILGDTTVLQSRVEHKFEEVRLALASFKMPEMPKELTVDLTPVGPLIDQRLEAFAKSDLGRMWATGSKNPEEEQAIIANAGANPEGANRLAFAIAKLDQMATLNLIKPATAKKYGGLLKQEFASSGDITQLARSFGIDLDAVIGQAAGGGARGGSTSGPAQF